MIYDRKNKNYGINNLNKQVCIIKKSTAVQYPSIQKSHPRSLHRCTSHVITFRFPHHDGALSALS